MQGISRACTSRSRSTRSRSRASTGSPTRSCASRTRRRSRRRAPADRHCRTRPCAAARARRAPASRAVADGCGDRERVLRRHRRPDPRGADDARPRPRSAQGCGHVEPRALAIGSRAGPGNGPSLGEAPIRLQSDPLRRSVASDRLARRFAATVPRAAAVVSARSRPPTASRLLIRLEEHGEQAEDQGERSRAQRDREPRHTAAVRPAQRAAPARAALRLRSRAVWRVLGAAGRQGDPLLRDAGRGRERQGDHDARGHAARCMRSRAARPRRRRRRCIRCSRPGSTCRCRTAATARTE